MDFGSAERIHLLQFLGIRTVRLTKFFLAMPLGFLLAAGLWFGLFYLQLGAPTLSSQWVDDVVQAKLRSSDNIQSNAAGRRLVFVGGSNVLFGIDAKRVTTETGIPTINGGLSAVLRVDEVFAGAKKMLHPGDTLVLALEYTAYQFAHEKFSPIQIDYVAAHDSDYFHALPLLLQLRVALETSAVRLLTGLAAMFWPPKNAGGSYSVQSLDTFGDDLSNAKAMMPAAFTKHIRQLQPIPLAWDEKSDFWPLYARFLDWCTAHRVRVMVTFPSFLGFAAYEKPAARRFFAQLQAWHQKRGISMLGTPQDFMYTYQDMYDTRWHLNDVGRDKRTTLLIKLLRQSCLGKL